MIAYLLKSGMLLFVFYAVYKLVLENEKMFRFNRAYLLGSLIFSFVIPLQLFTIKLLLSNEVRLIELEEIVVSTNNKALDKIDYSQVVIYILVGIYTLIAMILIFRFVKNLYSFYENIKNNTTQIINNQKIVLVKEPILPHSFWNTIFINKDEFENGKIPSELIAHEKAHLVQRHTLDILFVETLQIVFWFNPLIVVYKKAIKLNHEFLADEAVNKQFDSVFEYQKLLLNIASNKNTVALASNINYLITKKRFIMMSKKASPIKMIVKVSSVGIVFLLLLFAFSTKTTAKEIIDNVKSENKTVSEIVTPIQTKPDFPGGMEAFYMFVGKNFKIPAEASKDKINTKLYMQFMVEKDGSLSEFKVVKDAGYGLGEEAIRVLKLSPKWIPGTEKGLPLRTQYNLPITIQTEK